MDLDEPVGFEIICRKEDEDYKQIIQAIHRTRRKHKWEEFKYTIKYKIIKIFKIKRKIRGVVNCETKNIKK